MRAIILSAIRSIPPCGWVRVFFFLWEKGREKGGGATKPRWSFTQYFIVGDELLALSALFIHIIARGGFPKLLCTVCTPGTRAPPWKRQDNPRAHCTQGKRQQPKRNKRQGERRRKMPTASLPPPIRNRRFFSAGRLSLITPCCKSLVHVVNRVREKKKSVSYFSPKRACLWAGSHLEKVGRKEKFVSYRPPSLLLTSARWSCRCRLGGVITPVCYIHSTECTR